MKANAPEKLYLISDEGCVMLSYDPSTKLQDGDRYDFVDETVFPIEEGCDIEYVRKDAFIEKALEYLEPILTEYAGFYVGGEVLQHFKKYMRGE